MTDRLGRPIDSVPVAARSMADQLGPPALPASNTRGRLAAALRQFWPAWLALLPVVAIWFWARQRMILNSPVYGQLFIDNPIVDAGWLQGRLTAIGVLGRYLGLLVLPHTLSCDYSYNQIPLYGEAPHWWQEMYVWVSLGVVATLLATAAIRRRASPSFAWGVLFFFVMVLPTANLVMPIGSIMAERFLYLPSIGFCLVAALALEAAGPAWPRLTRVLPALVVAVFALRTHVRNADWQSELVLWRSAVGAAPESFKTHKGYANALWDAGRDEPAIDAAIASAEMGLGIIDRTPLTERRRDNTLFLDLGMYYRFKGDFADRRGQPGEARRFFQKSVDILLRARDVDRWVNQASRTASLKRGRPAEKITDVGNHRIYNELGFAWLRLGDWTKADEAGQYARRLAPGDPGGCLVTAAAHFGTGQTDRAAVLLIAALVLDPKNGEAWTNLVRCYEKLGVLPVPITTVSNNRALNDGNPLVRRQLNEACVEVARQFLETKRPEDARALREKAVTTYRVPPAMFPEMPGAH